MEAKAYTYPIIVKESHIDNYEHMNNLMYLQLFEEARWHLITENGYGFKKIQETGRGPVILEIHIRYLKEVHLGEHLTIHSQSISYDKKIAIMRQKMLREEEICCTVDIFNGLFDIKERKLVLPTPEWLHAIGY